MTLRALPTERRPLGRQTARRAWLAPIAVFFLLWSSLPAFAQDSLADLVEKLLPAVVNISTTSTSHGAAGLDLRDLPPDSPLRKFFKDFFDKLHRNQPSEKVTSLGSGFIVDPTGYIVTCNHVITDADDIRVTLQDDPNSNIKARVVGRDPKTDLAILKIEFSHPLPYVRWGNSDKARVGDRVVAIGNAFGLGGTVTSGIISARGRSLEDSSYDTFLQTDAPINKGNSGGPMFNMAGEVIGINSAIYSPTGGSVGIGFAIPSALAQPVLQELRKSGHIKRGWIGVQIQEVTSEIADTVGLPKAEGALVANAADGGPAAAAGLHAGDVILKFDGHDVTEMRDLPRIVADTEIGKTAPLEVWRKGQKISLKVKVGKLKDEEQTADTQSDEPEGVTPGAPSNAKQFNQLGLSLAPLSSGLRDQYQIDSAVKGVVVTAVEDGRPAADKGIQPGDVILEINQEAVAATSQVASAIDKARQSGRKSVLLLVARGNDRSFIALPIGHS
jgi:serine protease Do